MIWFLDEAVQMPGVPLERVIGLAPEPWLVSLVVAATVSSQGGDCVDVVVSRRSGALGLHDSILLRKGLVGTSEIITASGLDWTMVRFLAPNDGPAKGTVRYDFYGQDGPGFNVTHADIAAFTAAQVDDDRYLSAAPAISN